METVVRDIPKRVPTPSEIGTLGAYFQITEKTERQLVRSDERLISELVAVLDRQLIAAVEARSADELRAVRANVWPRYVRALRALYDTASVLVSDASVEALFDGIVDELSADLQKQESRFGSKLCEQAVFTLWTMKKIRCLAHEMGRLGEPKNKPKDYSLVREYHAYSLWAQFHLDMLFAAMKFDRPICEAIREPICDGLRASVNAYAIMRDALLLRQPKSDETPAEALPWDEEDERLLAASMRELNADFSNDRH